jgi:transcriptional regulator with XRE-family HTH domain
MNVGEKIKDLRKKEGLSQTEFGVKVGVKQQTVANWENGVIEPTVARLKRVADAFGVTVDYFKDFQKKDQVTELIDRLIAQGKIKSPEDISDDLVNLIMYAVKMDIASKLLEQD